MPRKVYAVIIALGLFVMFLSERSEPRGQLVTLGVFPEVNEVQIDFDAIQFKEPIVISTTVPPTTIPTTTTAPPSPPTTVIEVKEEVIEEEPEEVQREATPEEPSVQRSEEAAPQALSGGWSALAQCESGGDFGINTGNGYYGAFQFNQQTWDGVVERMGRSDLSGVRASDVSSSDQIAAAQQLYSERGLQPWPECGRYLS